MIVVLQLQMKCGPIIVGLNRIGHIDTQLVGLFSDSTQLYFLIFFCNELKSLKKWYRHVEELKKFGMPEFNFEMSKMSNKWMGKCVCLSKNMSEFALVVHRWRLYVELFECFCGIVISRD